MPNELVIACVAAFVAWEKDQPPLCIDQLLEGFLEELSDRMAERDPIYQEMFVGE